MALFNLRTGKPLDGPEAVIVSDLDAMIASPIAFRLHGRVHYLKPVTVKEFFAYANALVSLDKLKTDDKLTDEQLLEMYCRLIQSVCDTVTVEDVKSLTHGQATALIQLIVEHISGKAHADSEQKKKTTPPKIPSPGELLFPASRSKRPTLLQRLVSFFRGVLNIF